MTSLRNLFLALAVLVVNSASAQEPIVVNAGASLQAAIDAAPAGSVLKLGAGRWKERVVITKPLTLEGAGWEKTILAPDQHDSAAAARRAAWERLVWTTDRRALQDSDAAKDSRLEPTILIRETENVVLRGLKIGGKLFHDHLPRQGSRPSDPLVILQQSKATFEACALAGYYVGLQIRPGSEAEVQRCLIAAMWVSGISVASQGRLVLTESEVRTCYDYGVYFVPNGKSSRVERCRFSEIGGSAIHHEDLPLTVANCAFVDIGGFGVYASKQGRAVLKNNFFSGTGIWCPIESADLLEGNTIVNSPRPGITLSLGTKTRAVRNLIANSSVGFLYNPSKADPEKELPAAAALLDANWLWKNQADCRLHRSPLEARPLPSPAGTQQGDPLFVAAERQDFALRADSPARAANAGVAAPYHPAAPWPMLAEEIAIAPDGNRLEFEYWKTPGASASAKRVQELSRQAEQAANTWVAPIYQAGDEASRTTALEALRKAMASEKADEARAAVFAFRALRKVAFDQPSFRPTVRRLLASSDIPTRLAALSALVKTGADAEDLARVFALADDPAPEVRDILSSVLVSLTKHDLTGKDASAAMVKMLERLPRDSRNVSSVLSGAKFSPEIEARVLDLCRHPKPEFRQNFLYDALCGQANKSEASCHFLIQTLAIPGSTGKVAQGLTQGVADAQYPMVADAMLGVLERKHDITVYRDALICLGAYGNSAHLPALENLLSNPDTEPVFRGFLESALEAILARQ